MDVFIVDWIARDIDGQCELIGIGKDAEGECIAMRCPFSPHMYVDVPETCVTLPSRTVFSRNVRDKLSTKSGKCTVHLAEKRPFVGYQGTEPAHVVLCRFQTLRAFRNARYRTKDLKYKTYEANADPTLKFFHLAGIDPCGWTAFQNPSVVATNVVAKAYVREARVSHYTDITMADKDTPPPLKIASFDFECYSATNKFPNGSNSKDAIISVGTSYAMYGNDVPYTQTIHQLHHCDPLDGVDVHVHTDERGMLNAWLEELERERVDVITGYNIWGFDFNYLDARSVILIDLITGESSIKTAALGHLIEGGGERIEKNLASAAFGSNAYVYLGSPGIVQLDLLAIFRKELKMDSYTLNNVSSKYLDGFTKLDVSAKEMFAWFRDQDPEGLTKMADYCVRDTLLPIKLMHKLSTLTNQIEMSKVVCTPISYLNTRGQQIRCYSLLLKHAGKAGFVINDMEKNMNRDAYVGATVLDPKRGAYVDDIVTCLDFASLYPSIMRAHLMCPSTIVLETRYADLDGVEYYRVETTPGHVVSFAQVETAVVPKLLSDLANWRKAAKKDMAQAKDRGDAFAASLYNAKQLAFKVSMNSLYGFFGAGTGAIPLLDLASAVTCTGRDMIMRTKKACEERGHQVIYGDTDSVFIIQKIDDASRLDVAGHIERGKALAAELTRSLYKHPNELEYEKVYAPMLLFSKKRYAALMYEFDPTTPSKIDVKGLQLVRRDSPPFVRDVMTSVLDAIMYRRSFEEALQIARNYILDVLEDRVPFEKFVVSKSLRSGYKNPDSLPHVQVAEKRRRRNVNPPGEGERVPYVIIKSLEHANDLIAARAEDPVHVQENGLDLDKLFYVRNCLLKPLETIFDLRYDNAHTKITEGPIIEKMMALQTMEVSDKKESKRLRFLKDTKQREITSFFKKI